MINERIVSELLAFWRAGVYRLKALMEGPKRSELGKESSNLIVFVHSSCWSKSSASIWTFDNSSGFACNWLKILGQHGSVK